MTNPQDPFGYDPFTYDPLGRVPFSGPPEQLPAFTPPPPPPYRPPVNTLATFSVVFAFVFAPVGAILGHLGLAQIRRTGELGRDRALVGLSLSYAFIVLTVVALAGWGAHHPGSLSAQPDSGARHHHAPVTTSESPTAPTVAPDDDHQAPAEAGCPQRHHQRPEPRGRRNLGSSRQVDKDATIDRPQCWGSVTPGAPEAYDLNAILRYRAEEFSDTQTLLKSIQVIQAVMAFRDSPTAQSQVTKLVDGWRQCGGAPVTLTARGGPTYSLSLSPPADAGNGITTMDLAPKGLKVRFVRAAAAKANVVVDLYVVSLGTTDAGGPRQTAVSIANYILNKIPG